jgi:hypothetical protein
MAKKKKKTKKKLNADEILYSLLLYFTTRVLTFFQRICLCRWLPAKGASCYERQYGFRGGSGYRGSRAE